MPGGKDIRIYETDPLRIAIVNAYRMDETVCVEGLLNQLQFSAEAEQEIAELATQLILRVREDTADVSGVEALLLHYDLSTEEGIMLLCLAEALLRIPDKKTVDLLIRDRLTSVDWEQQINASESAFVNMTTWSLALTGKLLKTDATSGHFKQMWHNLLLRVEEPMIRKAVIHAINALSEQFVLGRTIQEALKKSQKDRKQGYLFSYDMLGEVARTQADADRYFSAYLEAIEVLGQSQTNHENIFHSSGISVKLSALHPRYEFSKRESVIPDLVQRLKTLVSHAMHYNISVTIDSEEADRLDLMLDIFEQVIKHHEFKNWHGLGLAVQAYQKRAVPQINWLIQLGRKLKKRIPVRLVKGAYWDAEIKTSQVGGFQGYPVFTRKVSTDLSYLICAKLMLRASDAIYSQFATHNAYTVAAILVMKEAKLTVDDFEFQKLQGMGNALHDQLVQNYPCRVYAPVGSHEDLLPYLVRRLLENGANSSFVNKIADKHVPIENLIENPAQRIRSYSEIPNPKIPLPNAIYGPDRLNSSGIDLSDFLEFQALSRQLENFINHQWYATPFNQPLNAVLKNRSAKTIVNPADHREIVGQVVEATSEEVKQALTNAVHCFESWNSKGHETRAEILIKLSNLLEQHCIELMLLGVKEAGRTLPNTMNEVREAIDFCRYYAMIARENLITQNLPGPTGESNQLCMHGRGVIVCISPWNFPISIFTGQIVAALVTGNCVIAKPAEQTPLVAARIVDLCYEAGIPREVLQLLPGPGEIIGSELVADPRVAGVIFTGSTETARIIHQTLAHRDGPIPLLIAETGGINALIADSSALPEQLIADVITSAFDSAGQRCSALRILCVQEDIADKVIPMLQGAMAEIKLGDPFYLSTDVGPVIDIDARKNLEDHVEKLQSHAQLIYRVELPHETHAGIFFPPQAYLIEDFSLVKKEVFGPILHVIRYQAKELDHLIQAINDLGYGLTFGIHSRIEERVDYIQKRIRAGNIYVNRNLIGAVVGVQPFGGSRFSGTGPKAGGPHYLTRLSEECTLTINTAAVGGNATLMTMNE